ncbi:MAG: hypothetical protein V1779_03960 [bacterium]
MMQVLHREVQYIRQKFLIALVAFGSLSPLVFFIIGLIMQLRFGIEFGNKPMSDNALITCTVLSAVFAILVFMLFKFSNLTIEVRFDGFYYKYFPFHLSIHKITQADVKSVTMRKFSALGEFGGWGIRYGFGKRGKGYIVSGQTGVQFILQNDKKVLFSTEEPEKMRISIEKVFKIEN